ncbi:hypothetical protein [Streptomyces sp. HNM1019]|uniref:hypothetical protein n=1 Tax=Streptomyces sp. HNM1019 TaxID=3424717 RepID=UPI003D76C932
MEPTMMTKAQPWKPPTTEIEALPVGEWWDAIRAPASVGEQALGALGALGEATATVVVEVGTDREVGR